MPNQDDANSTNSQSPRSSTSTPATQSTPATSPETQPAALPQAPAPPPQFQGQVFPPNFIDMSSTPTTPRSAASAINSPPAAQSPGLPSFLNLGSSPGSGTPTTSPGVPGTPHGSPSLHNPAAGTGQGGGRQGNPGGQGQVIQPGQRGFQPFSGAFASNISHNHTRSTPDRGSEQAYSKGADRDQGSCERSPEEELRRMHCGVEGSAGGSLS